MRSHGEGTVYERNGRWEAQLTRFGKRETKYFHSQKEAVDWLLKKRQEIKDNMPLSSDVTMEVLLKKYIENVGIYTLRDTTLAATQTLLRLHILPEIGQIKLCDLKATHLQKLYAKKLASGLSPRTVRFIHATIHVALRQAEKWEIIPKNVSELVSLPKVQKREFTPLTEEQIDAFLQAIKGHYLEALYLLALATGMRRGEVLGLHWSDIDFENSVIRVRYSIANLPGKGIVLSNVKTQNSRRTLPVPKTAMDTLVQYKNVQDKHPEGWIDTGLVFTTRSGLPISPRNVVREFKILAARAGLPASFRFHDLRHTTASLLLKSNVHPKVVQSILGHSQISVTMDIYSHLMPGVTADAMENIEDFLK